jgi:hypothetical protein
VSSIPTQWPIHPIYDAYVPLNKAVSEMGLEILREISILGVILKVVFRMKSNLIIQKGITPCCLHSKKKARVS